MEIFTFLSGLYFRGKLAYARAFASPPPELHGVYVITPNHGLIPADQPTSLAQLKSFSRVAIDAKEARYRRPLVRDATPIAEGHPTLPIVLPGSISTGKYVHALFAERLYFPIDFVGRGDMSRGGLMLRCAQAMKELAYAPVKGAVRHGTRPRNFRDPAFSGSCTTSHLHRSVLALHSPPFLGNGLLTRASHFDAITVPFGERLYVRSH